ncbi:MAG TPA: RNA methyltransferase [Cytophagales bacterium]|jgi:23S rRNA (guanosine2251-2'-O)-methyltransferase|nr:RNA methyltransferase [Cytophagales bacterium]
MRKLKLDELGRASVDEFRNMRKNPIVIVLDNVRSAHNVGSVFRTADAFAIEKIYLCGITATPPHREINKTALGSTEAVEWEHADSTEAAIRKLQALNYEIAALEQADLSVSLDQFEANPNQKYALVFGNEVYGVEDHVVKAADHVVEIPQYGTKHSLNVSVSVGIALWHFIHR